MKKANVVTDEEDGGETSGDVHVVGGPGEAGAKLPGSKKSHESDLDQGKLRGGEWEETYPGVEGEVVDGGQDDEEDGGNGAAKHAKHQ